MVIGDITKNGLCKLPYGPTTQIQQDKRILLIDVGTMKLIRAGHLTICSGVEKLSGNQTGFEDGKETEFEVVVFATGNRPRVDNFILDAFSAFTRMGRP